MTPSRVAFGEFSDKDSWRTTGTDQVGRPTSLITDRNRVDGEIAATIGRPALPVHIGRFVAAAIFDIRPYKSPTHRGRPASSPAGHSLADR